MMAATTAVRGLCPRHRGCEHHSGDCGAGEDGWVGMLVTSGPMATFFLHAGEETQIWICNEL